MEYDIDEESPTIVAVAVSESRNGQHAVKWALEKFVPKGINLIKLLHVLPKSLKTPRDQDETAVANRKDIEWKTNMLLLPYRQMCAERQVEAEYHIIEAENVADGISKEIVKFAINKLVIGSSSQSAFSRKLRGDKTSALISQCAPYFCTVYVISKGGKLSSVHPASYLGESIRNDRSGASISSSCHSSHESSARSDFTDADSSSSISNFNTPSLQRQRSQALRTINQGHADASLSTDSTYHTSQLSFNIEVDVPNGVNQNSSYRSIEANYLSRESEQASVSDMSSFPNAENQIPLYMQVDVGFEIERLRIELKHLQGLYEKTQIEKNDESRKMIQLNALHLEESTKLKEMYLRQMKAEESAASEIEAHNAAKQEAQFVRECVEKEILQREDMEYNTTRETEEKEKLERALSSCEQKYKRFDWKDIVSATSSFSDDLKIGKGANGTVYKGRLHHTSVAIKLLHSNEVYGTKQFQQELDILGQIRHPNLLLLIGACPERGCLVYEYMENGSLDDRLKCKSGSPPLQWFHRFRIAWEVASALSFLHHSKPEAIVHRDLKPANILLDHNLVSKIGDLGLSSLLTASSSTSTICKQTAPVGTFCYIDPEYQRTGELSPKCDIYSLGMVILQLLTAKSPMGLPDIIETAIDDGRLQDVLDSNVWNWPIEETQELALLGLTCVEFRRKDRPDMETEILPLLEKLRRITDDARDLVLATVRPPDHFICPILQEVMDEPCVAADGYSYDRKAIQMWFSENDKSPLRNLQLPNKNLIPNRLLHSEIEDWRLAIRY